MQLGEIFVQQNILSQVTVDRAVPMARSCNQRIGLLLKNLGLVTEKELLHALSGQLGLNIAGDFASRTFDPVLLSMVAVETALKYLVFPLKLEEERLALAMADPTDRRATEEIASTNRVTVVPLMALCGEITAAVCRHYLNRPLPAKDPKPTLLIVDDDRMLLVLLDDIFSPDYRVITAGNGKEGYLEALRYLPDVILTDLEMPRMDGLALIAALKENPATASIPAILMSGRGEADDEEMAVEKGFFDFIQKPFSMGSLQARVKRAANFSAPGMPGRLTPTVGQAAITVPAA